MSDMSLNKYQELAARTAGAGQKGDRREIIAALGLAGEAGEFANIIKKKTAHGHAFENNEIAEELGDVLWYLAEAASASGLALADIAIMNVEKLKNRYPEGFSHERSINRDK